MAHYLKISSLAAALDMSVKECQAHVAAGRLPQPYTIRDTERWCWSEVDAFIRQAHSSVESDPLLEGLSRVPEAAATRSNRSQQDRATVHVLPKAPRHATRIKTDSPA